MADMNAAAPPADPVPASTVLERLGWRYAVKKFDATRTIDPATWEALERSLVLAPSSYGLQPWKFFVVTRREVKEPLVAHSWGQKQVADCSHLVVFALKIGMNPADADRLVARTVEVRGGATHNLKGYRDMMAQALSRPQQEVDDWSNRQIYIALGQFMAAAALVGVDTCPMEGFVAERYDALLGLKERGYTATVLCPAGYRAADDRNAGLPKVRFPEAELVEHIDALAGAA